MLFASFWWNMTAVLSFALLAATGALAHDASIDRLLNKLPSPEKLIKPPVKRAMEQPDPAFKDPLGRRISQAIETYNFPQALNLSRKGERSHTSSRKMELKQASGPGSGFLNQKRVT